MKSVKHCPVATHLLHQLDIKHVRLYRMGLVDLQGAPELLGLEMLASTTSGCLYDDLERSAALALYFNALVNLIPNHPEKVYSELAKAYSNAGEPVPKPVQLLAKDECCLLYFLFAYFENWREYLYEDGLLEV